MYVPCSAIDGQAGAKVCSTEARGQRSEQQIMRVWQLLYTVLPRSNVPAQELIEQFWLYD